MSPGVVVLAHDVDGYEEKMALPGAEMSTQLP